MIKLILKKIADGMILGIGIGISGGIIMSIISNLMYRDIFNEKEIEKIQIKEHHEIKRKGISTFLGNLKSNSDKDIRGFQVKVDLYDLNGTLVDQCNEYISTLASQKETNFKVVCKKCDQNKTVEHDTYKIYINSY